MAEDDYFLTLCRYVEANAVRGKLVERAEQWRWCGLWRRAHRSNDLVLSPWPEERPRNWKTLVSAGLSEEELRVVRECVGRGRPLGPAHWVLATAARLRLGFTLRGPGRPPKDKRQSVTFLFLSSRIRSLSGAQGSSVWPRISGLIVKV